MMNRRPISTKAAGVVRAANGKFVNARGTHRSKRGLAGRQGPGRLARMDLPALALRLVDLEDRELLQRARLGEGGAAKLLPKQRANTVAMTEKKRDEQFEKACRVREALIEITQHDPKWPSLSKPALAAALETLLGERVTVRSLYRPMLRSIVEQNAAPVKQCPNYASREERIRRYSRESRQLLIHWILQMEAAVAAADANVTKMAFAQGQHLRRLVV